MLLKVNDSIKPFIESKMKQVDSDLYTDEDFKAYFSNEHINYVYVNKQGSIIAFGCILIVNGIKYMTYTWCDGTTAGKRGYSIGFKGILKELGVVYFDEYAINHLKKLQRINNNVKNITNT